jgi:hypothetical protein
MGCRTCRERAKEVSLDVVLDRRVCGLVHWLGLNCFDHVGRDPRTEVRSESHDPGWLRPSRGFCGVGTVAGLHGSWSLTAAVESTGARRGSGAGAGRREAMKAVWVVTGIVLLLLGLG